MLLALVGLSAASASAAPPFPFPFDWAQFPSAWFGGNATHWESESQLEAIGKYSMAIFGWNHLITATNWTASLYAQLNQAAIVKARHPHLPVYVYAGFGPANGYNAAAWPLIKGASDGCPGHQPCRAVPPPYTDWFLETSHDLPVYSMSACEQMGLGYTNPPTDRCWGPFWNVANPAVRDFFIERIIAPIAAAPFVDGVFFDGFNMAYDMPTPWNRVATNVPNCTPKGGSGCEALLAGTLELARRVALALNDANKVAMFSNAASFTKAPGFLKSPIWLDEARLIDALENTTYMLNYEFMRAESIASSGTLANMLRESRLAVPMGVHTYYKSLDEDPTPHLAAFMLVRQEYWYYFGSTGWFDDNYQWSPLYEKLSTCGRPKGLAVGSHKGSVFTREYEHCTVTLDCTAPSDCKGSIAFELDLA